MGYWGYRWEKYGDCLVTLSTERKRDRFWVKQFTPARHRAGVRMKEKLFICIGYLQIKSSQLGKC